MALPHVKTNLGNVRTHTRKVAEEITHRWTFFYVWGVGGSGHHAAGRALDFMTLTADQSALRTRVGNELAAYLQDQADRLGILYIIWRQRIWNDSRSDDRSRTSWSQWRRMADRGSPTENHMDHVHVSFRNNPPPYRSGGRSEDEVSFDDELSFWAPGKYDESGKMRAGQQLNQARGYSHAAYHEVKELRSLVEQIAGGRHAGAGVWRQNIPVPWGSDDNPEWYAQSILRGVYEHLLTVEENTVQILEAVQLATGTDLSELIGRVREQLESVKVRLEVGSEEEVQP